MYELKVKNNAGEVLNLTGNYDYTVYKIDGLAPPQVSISQSENVTTDGSVINSARINTRNLVIYMAINGDIERNRINLYKYFPPKHTVKIYFSNNTRDVYIEGMVELIECDLFTNRQVAQISIICPKPYFKDINDLVVGFSDVNPLFQFPFSLPAEGMAFSEIVHNIRKTIINTGDSETGAIIQLFADTGAVVNPVIYDVNKRIKLKLNMTLQRSDLVTINTNVGEKSITLTRAGVSSNAMGYMSQDSNWLTLGAGDNLFTYECDDDTGANLQITFRTSILYSGV